MTASVYYESQFFTTTLSVVGGIDASQTTGIVLQSVTGIFDTTKPGVALFSYADPLSTTTAEWATFTSINSTTKTLVGVTRGAEGYSAKTHANGVTIAFPHSKSHINQLAAALSIGGSATNAVEGVLDEDTMSSDSATKLATQQSIKAYVDTQVASAGSTDGWTSDSATWTYASATTFTIAGVDVTAKFRKGTKIKLTQTTAKYFYVVSSTFSTDTTVTVTGGGDYTVANAAITSPFYSYELCPQGFPAAFTTGTVTWTVATIDDGAGGQPTAGKSYFLIEGNKVTHYINLGSSNVFKAGAGTTMVFTLPSTMPAISSTYHNTYCTLGVGNSVGGDMSGLVVGCAGALTAITLRAADTTNIADNTQITDLSAMYSYLF